MSDTAMPLERFIQAITAQLDRAQEALALKARFGLPLTFAVKDLSLDLRAHVDLAGEVVSIRPAGPGDIDSSVIHLNLTTITRPMIEENTISVAAGKADQTIQDALGHELSPEEQRRLEWAGVYTVGQLRDLQRHASAGVIERVAALPVDRLRTILHVASQPRIDHVRPVDPQLRHRYQVEPDQPQFVHLDPPGHQELERRLDDTTPRPELHISGRNFLSDVASPPRVRLAGTDLPVLRATPREIFAKLPDRPVSGALEVVTDDGSATAHFVALPADAEP